MPEYGISTIELSKFKKGKVFVGYNGFGKEDYSFYLFVSDNYGKDWEQIDFPFKGVILNVLKEDFYNKNIIYAGTNIGMFVSKNLGKNWRFLKTSFDFTPVLDITIDKKYDKFIISTFGRGLFSVSYKELISIFNDFPP